MIYSPATEQCDMSTRFYGATETVQEFFIPQEMSSFVWPINKFSVGSTVYIFLKPVRRCYMTVEDEWISYIRELPIYSGKGKSAEESFEDLKINIHVDFQQLQRIRPFEMNDDEKSRWSDLASVIDLLEYRMTTPVVVREIGQVSYHMRSRPYRIKWITGENYIIEPERVPGDLMACRTGEWIEAVVKRDPVTNRVLEIESINRIRFRIPTETEIRKFWGNIPLADLPRSDWSW